MPEDSQAQSDSPQEPAPIVEQIIPQAEQAAPAPEATIQTAAEPAAPTEPAQVPSEPIVPKPVIPPESVAEHAESTPLIVEPSIAPQEPQPLPSPAISPLPRQPAVSQVEPSLQSLFAKGLNAIRFRKKAKLEKIMKFAQEKRSITNDQAQKLLRVSDATATRYLSELVRQTRLKRTGTTTNIRYEPFDFAPVDSAQGGQD